MTIISSTHKCIYTESQQANNQQPSYNQVYAVQKYYWELLQ